MRLSLFFLVCCLSLTGCGGDRNAGGGGSPWGRGGPAVTPSVEAIQARYGALPLQERLSGTVRADNQVIIYPEISAPIVRVAVENGAAVRAGQPLVYLRDTQFQEQLRQAEAALAISQAEAKRTEANLRELRARLERTRQLVDRQFQSQQDLDVLQAQADAAEATYQQSLGRIAQSEANVEEAKEALRRTVVRSPISGRVGQRNAEIGMRVDPGTRLFTVGNFETVRVVVAITDDRIGQIREGQTALIRSETLGQTLEAEVSRISPFLEAGSFSAEAEIDVPNRSGQLRPGMFVTVDILYGESEQATLVPVSALYEDPNTGVLGVFVAPSLGTETPLDEPDTFDKDNPPQLTEPTPAVFREIEVLAEGRGLAGVTGVQGGDWVVTVGQNLLRGRENVQARVRPITWARVAELQEMQDQDLLRQFMEKQQRYARDGFQQATPDTAESPSSARPTPDSTTAPLRATPAGTGSTE